MSRNVGFDFDGVIHTQVFPVDKNGHRNPYIPLNSIPDIEFTKIIDLIKKYHKHKYNIYIITARGSEYKNVIKLTLKKFGISDIIPESNLYFTGNRIYNGNKIDVLEQLNITDFYDDSIYHFKTIYLAKKQNKLQNLKNCYMTLPENNTILKIKI